MKNTNKNILSILSYIALIIVSLLIVVQNFLPIIHIKITGGFVNLLDTIKNLLVLIVVGFAGYSFTVGRKKWVKILFWVSVAIYVVGTVLKWIV